MQINVQPAAGTFAFRSKANTLVSLFPAESYGAFAQIGFWAVWGSFQGDSVPRGSAAGDMTWL